MVDRLVCHQRLQSGRCGSHKVDFEMDLNRGTTRNKGHMQGLDSLALTASMMAFVKALYV
jgi:hypothetical protein